MRADGIVVKVMTTWFTADLHLGHQNIIRYCDRPFADVEAMNRALVERWNEVVGDDDVVWVLGDFALGRIARRSPSRRTFEAPFLGT